MSDAAVENADKNRGSNAPPNRTRGNIQTKALREYIPKSCYNIHIRLKFLGWEVDVELLEVFAGTAIWVVLSDMIGVLSLRPPHSVYDLAFKIRPPYFWLGMALTIGFMHLIAILFDRSAEPDFVIKEGIKAPLLKLRAISMAFAFLFNFAVTASIFAAYTYTLSWKLMAMFTIAAFFSHIRLRKDYAKLVKTKRKQKESDNNTC